MLMMAGRSTTPQSPSSLTPSMDSLTPPPDVLLRHNNHYAHRVTNMPGGHSISTGGSRQSTPDSGSDTESESPRGVDVQINLAFTEDMTVAPQSDPYAHHRPSVDAAPFIPSGHGGGGHPHAAATHSPQYNTFHNHHGGVHHLGTPKHMHGPNGGPYRPNVRHSLSPSSVNHHDVARYGNYAVSPQNAAHAPSPHGGHGGGGGMRGGGHHPHLGPPPQHQHTPHAHHQHHYRYPDPEASSNVDAQFMFLAGDPLPSPKHFDYGGGGPMHLQTPRHMRMAPNGTPKVIRLGDEKRTFYALRLLEKVQYCAYKLDNLQEKYRDEYLRQQELFSQVQGLRAVSPRNPQVAQMSAFCAASRDNIKRLLIHVSQYYSQMRVHLEQRVTLHLTPDEEGIFTKFQNYFDRFEQTQMHLVHAGIQHFQQANLAGGGGASGPPPAQPMIPPAQPTTIMNGGMGHHAPPSRTSGIPNHGFITPGTDSRGRGSLRGKESTDPNTLQPTNTQPQQIPDFGYVVIGTRMSQMISLIVPALAETEQQTDLIREYIEHLLKQNASFSRAKVVSYGSATNDLFIKGSDLNFCVKMQPLGMKIEEAQMRVTDVLRNESLSQVRPITRLNGEKGIRFFHPQTALTCELSFNTMKEIGSSRLIRAYATIDSRFKHIAQVVKHWSLKRNICAQKTMSGSKSGSDSAGSMTGLTPYGLVLMVINFLQQRRPPVLPILSIMVEPETGASPWADKDDFQINTQKFREFAAKNEESAAQLLVAFFRFYAHEFDTRNLVVSVRTGSFLTKSEKKWDEDSGTHLLSIEDPFDSNKDLGENIRKSNVHFIVSEFMRACRVLGETYKIYDVCKSYHSEKDILAASEQSDSLAGGSILPTLSGGRMQRSPPGPSPIDHGF